MPNNKPIHAKPSLYAFYFEIIKEIGLKYGYNIVLHGSMNRDLDLIAIPWIQECKPEILMIDELANVLGGSVMQEPQEVRENNAKLKHGRKQYVININRDYKLKYQGMVIERVEFSDPQTYIDISVMPTLYFDK